MRTPRHPSMPVRFLKNKITSKRNKITYSTEYTNAILAMDFKLIPPSIIFGNGNFMGSFLLASLISLKRSSDTKLFSFSAIHPSTPCLLCLEKMSFISSSDSKLLDSCSSMDCASGRGKCTIAWTEFSMNSDSFLGLNRSSGGTYISRLNFVGRLSVRGSKH